VSGAQVKESCLG